MSDMIKPVIDQFKFNSMVLSLATSDLKNEDAGHRLRGGEGSSVSFLIGHLLSSRYGLLKMLDAGEENPYAQLLAPPPEGFPIEDQTIRGGISFLSWHESYHVGQIGVLRTELGYSSTEHQVHAAMTAKSE